MWRAAFLQGLRAEKKFCAQPLQKIAVGAILQKLFEPP